MRFNTHNRTPKIKTSKSVKLPLIVICCLLFIVFAFLAIVYALYINSVEPAVIIFTPMLILSALFLITQIDMEKAYIEVSDDTIHVVDYYFGFRKQKSFLIQEIADAEIVIGSSMRVHGYRYSMGGAAYLIFRDHAGKYLFKVLCVPETRQFFEKYFCFKIRNTFCNIDGDR